MDDRHKVLEPWVTSTRVVRGHHREGERDARREMRERDERENKDTCKMFRIPSF